MTLPSLLTTLVFVLCAACATTSPPSEKAENSAAAVRAAEEVGATHSPTAALHLQLAKEQFEYASQLKHPDQRAKADRLMMRAQADAELALALARSEDEKAAAQGAVDKVKKFKQSATQ
jgi:hypothetical protein